MKFLCVTCDTAMKLEQSLPPRNGALTVVFACPKCGRQTALLTNAMETQMVRSLGVEIGGRTMSPEPMGLVRRSLLGAEGAVSNPPGNPDPAPPATASAIPSSESKCPFSGVVSEAMARSQEAVVWSREAEARIQRIPAFAQPMVRVGVEMHARQNGVSEITEAIIDQVKARFGM
jgi:hypothetical protein